MFNLPSETEMSLELLSDFMSKHKELVQNRYKPLQDAYLSDYEIDHLKPKEPYKPDNRISVNFAKYIVDTMNGFFLGNPIKTTSEDEAVSEFVEYLEQYNDLDDANAELAKTCSIFGQSYEMYYTDEFSQLCTTYLSPMEAFMIHDDSVVERPLFFIRYYKDWKGIEHGSLSDSTQVRYFRKSAGYEWEGEWEPHFFDGVPATEFIENAERQSIYESVLPLINAYNKAVSEKANDVDYFADAYLKVLGAKIEEGDLKFIRDNRVINFEGDTDKVVAEFMSKPEGDETQENLLDRLERLIYQISMVANISDENFGTASGIAMKYKLQAMSNLEKAKERKFTAGMNRRYQLLFSSPVSKVPEDSWVQLQYQFTPNIPANLLEETQIAQNLSGIVSDETQLKALSIVDNVQAELDRMKEAGEAEQMPIIGFMKE